MNTRMTVEDRLTALIAEYGDAIDSNCEPAFPDGTGHFLLVEESRHSGQLWLTRHKSLAAAAKYHDEQESPDDWEIRYCLNLADGKHYDGWTAHKTTWTFNEASPRNDEASK